MQVVERRKLMLFSGSANQPLAEEVAKLLDVELGGLERSVFANGEIGPVGGNTYVHGYTTVLGIVRPRSG